MKKRWYLLQMAGVLLLAILIAGSTAAYLSMYTETAENTITAGSVKIELNEPNWNANAGKRVYPGQKVIKDPIITNTGDREANVFLEVFIPVEKISVLDEITQLKTEKMERELFSFAIDEKNWELLSTQWEVGGKRYVYGYKWVLGPGMKTSPLFWQIQVVPYVEGELKENRMYEILVTAKAIQRVAQKQSLGELYTEYLKQYDADSKG